MPRKVKTAPEIVEKPVEIPLEISKKTGKPKKKLTELQLETLRKGRELAVEKRKQMVEGIDLNKRTELMKLAKEEKREAKNILQKKALKDAKENYIKEVIESDDEILKKPSKSKKSKKKIIKYIEKSSSSDSDSSAGEVIIRKKKKDVKKSELIEKSSVDILKKQLDSERNSDVNDFMKPSYF